MAEAFTNWSGSLACTPRDRVRPTSGDEVAATLRRAAADGLTVRPVGSGHSSMPLVTTGDVMLSVDDMRGVTSVDPDAGLARVLPGTGLAELGAELAGHGLAMENLGDVDYQSIAGAIGTGTHGTGIRLGNLSSTLVGGTMVTGGGEEVPFGVEAAGDRDDDDDDDLTRAVQVSLGALGVFTSLTLRVLPAYDLHRINWMTHIDWVLGNLDQLLAENRHVDFYWYPRSDLAQVRMLNPPGEEPGIRPPGELRTDETGPSYEILPNHRELFFEEMEYMLPLEVGPDAFREARERIKAHHRQYVGWRRRHGPLPIREHCCIFDISYLIGALLIRQRLMSDLPKRSASESRGPAADRVDARQDVFPARNVTRRPLVRPETTF